MKIAIVGGGVVGLAVALELADRGHAPVVLDRGAPGAEASSAAAGILGAQIEDEAAPDLIATLVRARSAYAAWVRALEERTRIDVGYRASGVIRVAHTKDELDELAHRVKAQQAMGLRAELVDPGQARAIEPCLATDGILGGAHLPDDAQVEPPRLVRALLAALADGKADVRAGTGVQQLRVESGKCTGVVLDDGVVEADAVVLAAGSWSSLVPGVPAGLPAVRPVRGQMVQLEERPPRLRAIVVSARAYAVPRGDGRVACGSTLEHVGYRREVTAFGVRSILDGVLAAVPSLAEAEMTSTWCGFRPHSASDRPLVGSSPLPGLVLATGHHRNGILLAKHTAEEVAAVLAR